jgi:hypothetical protein
MKLMVLKTKIVKYIAGLALALSVTACASTENVSRNKVLEAVPQAIEQEKTAYKVQQLSVTVPGELTVSEANRFLPMSDIVWREDPLGDRKQQVQSILANAIAQGVSKVEEGRPVTMEVRMNKFHALTEKARYTTGGRHNINFDYVLRDATTGVPIADAKNVDVKFKAYGGARAVSAMAHGDTQKVRITKHIQNLMYLEMSGNTEI